MSQWPNNPAIYEINTWIWLHGLSQRYHQPITLANVSPDEWDAIAEYHFDAVWLMGVWERSPRGITIAREHPDLQPEYRRALDDFDPQDVTGSPYSVHRYVVDAHLGGPEGLAVARQALSERGMRLILDFVPNHVAPDHPWTVQHPEFFIRGTLEELAAMPDYYFEAAGHVFANGRDPYFPAWTDTAQLNAFDPGLRQAVTETLSEIAVQSDGVRCDMAMLVTNRIFAGTWGARAGERPEREFWPEVVSSVKDAHPNFLFMAEAYWDMEWELQQQGFDFCYDKRLYDRLAHETPAIVNQHLMANLDYQNRLVRFIENHDEPRAAAVFSTRQARAAAMTVATLPGARLFHDGQFEGLRRKLPVQLGRHQPEPVDGKCRAFYRTLLEEIARPVFHDGSWQLCHRTGWSDNTSHKNIVAWCWKHKEECRLIIINLSDQPSQAQIQVPWGDLSERNWRLSDPYRGDIFERSGSKLLDPGLYVDLKPYDAHFLHVEPA